MIDTVFVGIGSAIGADQIGWQIVEQLQRVYANRDDIAFVQCDRNPVEWIMKIPPARRLIFCDAAIADDPPGTVRHFSYKAVVTTDKIKLFSSHGFSLLQAIELAENLGLNTQAIDLVTVTVNPTSNIAIKISSSELSSLNLFGK